MHKEKKSRILEAAEFRNLIREKLPALGQEFSYYDVLKHLKRKVNDYMKIKYAIDKLRKRKEIEFIRREQGDAPFPKKLFKIVELKPEDIGATESNV